MVLRTKINMAEFRPQFRIKLAYGIKNKTQAKKHQAKLANETLGSNLI